MIHKLRLTLEKHITNGIPGLVNSGKTQLIKTLFGLDVSVQDYCFVANLSSAIFFFFAQVKAGITENRTIIPFMYSLAPDVKNVHVINLPGADDSDKNVSQLTEFLKFVSQIVCVCCQLQVS